MTRPSPRQALSAVLIGLCFCLLICLGLWQMRRLAWKEALLARIETRALQAPEAAPAPAEWPALRPEDYDYRHVRLAGHFEPAREARIFAVPPPGAGLEPGYRIATLFRLSGGGAVFVLRGFTAQSKAGASPWRSGPQGDTVLVGHMRAPQGRNMFTPADTPAGGLWYTIDPAAMAAALGATDAAPFFLDEDADAESANGLLRQPVSIEDIPNNHLSYAVTWFGLAGALALVVVFYLRGRRARP